MDDYYPMRGYIYRTDGYHDGGIELPDRAALERFLNGPVIPAVRGGLEVRVTDCWDLLNFHAKDGVILWPTQEVIDSFTGTDGK